MLSPQKIVDNADAVAAVLDVIADITDMQAVRKAEVVVAGVRAAIALLEGLGDGTLDAADIDKRVDALRDDLKATDAKHDAALAKKFDVGEAG